MSQQDIIIILIAGGLVLGLIALIAGRRGKRKPANPAPPVTHNAPSPSVDLAHGHTAVPDGGHPDGAAQPSAPAAPPVHPELSQSMIEQKAQAAFEKAIAESTEIFKHNIEGSSQRLSDLVVRLTTNVVEQEMEVYRKELDKARDAAIASLQNMQTVVESKQSELETGVEAQLEARKTELLGKLDEHLGKAVVAYIVEALGQGADLGAQRTYLLANLEKHKDELKKDLNDAL